MHLTEKDDVPCLECYTIIQDSNNLMWLAGNTGLFSYNGESFTEHSITDQKGQSVFNLSEDEQGTIWCNNLHGQILRAPNGKQLSLFKDLNNILKGSLAQLHHVDQSLVVSWSQGLLVLNKSTGEAIFKYSLDIIHSQAVEGKLYFITQMGEVYQLTDNELVLLYKFKTKNSIRYPYFLKVNGELAISSIENQQLQIQLFGQEEQLKKFSGFTELKNVRIAQVAYLGDEMWFATDNGVLIYESQNGDYQLKNHILEEFFITSVTKDKDSNYWLSTLRNGVFLIPNIALEKLTLDWLKGSISSMAKTDSLLVLSTTKGEIILMGIDTMEVVDSLRLPDKSVINKIFFNPFTNRIIVSTNGDGSYSLDLATKRLIPQNRKYDVSKDLAFLNERESIYLTYNKSVLYNNSKSKEIDSSVIMQKRPYAVVADTLTKESYIAYIDELVHYDSLWRHTSIRYKDHPIYVSNLANTVDGIVWGSNPKHGIIGIKNREVVKTFNLKDGLLGTNIQNLESDGHNLWLNTQHGIQLVDTQTGDIKSITGRDGVPNNLVDIKVVKNQVFAASQKDLFLFDKNVQTSFKQIRVPDMYFTQIKLNNKDTAIQSTYRLPHQTNAISFGFHANTFRSSEFVSYEYQLQGLDTTWLTTNKSPVTYESLPPGKFTFNIRPVSSEQKGKTLSVDVSIARPFWSTWWFFTLNFLVVGVSVGLYFKHKIRTKEEEKQKELASLIKDKRLTNLKLENLRSQMNPHFMFNALNSIQLYIINNEKDLARTYLVKFSRLIRIYLEHGQKNEVTLAEEIEALKLYLQLEKIRFEEKLDLSIQVAPEVDVNGTKIPSIFIQPYVENAIKHGLRREAKQNKLSISFDFNDAQTELVCTIKDNGIGINASEEQKKSREHKPFANRANMERVELYNLKRSKKIQLEVIDLKILGQQGTLVTINIPLQKNG
ncbi:MAG: hypothetical protein GYB37_07960 [Algicola sp.]|nr:hypothetical protein [Algicola sp.]